LVCSAGDGARDAPRVGVRRPTRIHTFLAGAILLALTRCVVAADGGVADVASPLREAGEMCGGIAGLRCADGLDCFFPPGSCGRGDQPGTCSPRPEICPYIYKPVCGCDGRTYANRCVAARSGVSVDRRGVCGERGEPDGAGSSGR